MTLIQSSVRGDTREGRRGYSDRRISYRLGGAVSIWSEGSIGGEPEAYQSWRRGSTGRELVGIGGS